MFLLRLILPVDVTLNEEVVFESLVSWISADSLGRSKNLQYLGKPSKKINSGYNEFGTISLNTLPPLINSEKSNSENWSQSGYPPSLRK